MVVLRLKRQGRRHRPFYRVIEQLGWYDPLAPEDRQVTIDVKRADYWLSVGAQPSRTVASLLKRLGCEPKPGKKAEDSH
jgi:small subunit ribosomal protein S16